MKARNDNILELFSGIREIRKKMLEARFNDLELAFRGGDKSALLRTIFLHFRYGEALPKWTHDAFIEAYQFQPKCWDDAFGRPDGKGAQKKEEVKAFYVASNNPNKHVDDLLEEIANKIRKSVGTAKRRYYTNTRGDLENFEYALNYLRSEYGLCKADLKEWHHEIEFFLMLVEAELIRPGDFSQVT